MAQSHGDFDVKARVDSVEMIAAADSKGRDKASELLRGAEGRIVVTPDENRRVLRKIDLTILPILLVIYCLQSLDKTTLSYASVFGLIKDTNLVGDQYSWLGSIVYIAQLVMQPPIAYFLVKLPIGKFTAVTVFLWGATLCCMAAARDFGGLLATRFLLGAFEAAVGKQACIKLCLHPHAELDLQLPPLSQSFRCGTDVASRQTETPPGTPCWVLSTLQVARLSGIGTTADTNS